LCHHSQRFDIARHPNEPNRAGYVVEIDPLDPKSNPKKRTALGRFKHENAEVVLAASGRAGGGGVPTGFAPAASPTARLAKGVHGSPGAGMR